MKNASQGALIYDARRRCYDIRFDLADYLGGLHCGTCFEVMSGGHWLHTRIEMDRQGWYLVGVETRELDGLRVRI